MASKDVKLCLKTAKECMDKKEFGTAAQHCKNALHHDRKNYMALVLYGVCLQETEKFSEALKAFQRAISFSPELPLAWKGLSTFYEKQNNESDRGDLLKCYLNLFKIETDIAKAEEWARKMGVLLSLLDHDALCRTWNSLTDLPEEKKRASLKMFLSVIGSMQGDAPEAYLPIMEQLLSESWADGKQDCINLYKKYLKLLFKLKNLSKILIKSKELFEKYPEVVAGPEWFCKAYLEAKFGVDCYEDEIPEPSEMYMILINMVPDSYLGFACKGVDELACNEFVAACDSLTTAVQVKSTYAIAWYLLTQGQVWLHRYADAENSARQALHYWKPHGNNTQSINNCKYWLAKALSEQDTPSKWLESVRIADQFLFDNPNKVDFLPILVTASIKLGKDYEKYMEALKKEESLSLTRVLLEARFLKKNNKKQEYVDMIKKNVNDKVESSELWLEMGMILMEEEDLKGALRCVLKAAKLNQWCPENYCNLGHIYRKFGDLLKARRCYQKAFQLNPSYSDAGIGLSDCYRILGMEEENLQLLSVATQVPGSRWAWLKLGLHYQSVDDPVQAVNSLRVAARLNENDRHAWESLGDAYIALGSYNAAIKSYQKVLELEPNLAYPLHQMATAKHLQGLHEESVLEFRQALALQKDFLAALQGHAVSCLALMRTRLTANLNGLASDSCQEAVQSLTRILNIKKDWLSAWKLIGEACVLISKLPPKYCSLKVSSWLTGSSDSEDVTITLLEILQLGVKSYCNAIALSPDLPELWLDLACCYHTLADAISSSEAKLKARRSALASVKKSLKLKESWRSWNLIGIISMSQETRNYPLAQHSFVKATQLDQWQPEPWSNLGSLNLHLGDLQLANQCFTEAQKCDPDYVHCWVGQAMLAEATGHHEAMDLYRHSTQLTFQPEGALGYARMALTKIVSTLDKTDKDYVFSIKNMNAVVIAADVLTWFTDRFPNDACAFNMHGLLAEKLRLYRQAAASFEKSLELLATGEDPKLKDKALHNYGRVLVQLGKPDKAAEVLKKISAATFENQCCLAMAYCKAGQMAEAYDTYQRTLEWLAPDDETKAHVLVAMAGVVYQHQGHQDAKILLMQACQLQPVPVAGLFALCALGLLHSDLSLTELALKELIPFQYDNQYLADVALLQALTQLIKSDAAGAQAALSRRAHEHPEDPRIWLNLGLVHLLIHPQGDAKAATKCFDRALSLGRSTIDVSKVTSLKCLGYLLAGHGKESLRSAQKAVQLYPEVAENWAVLLAAIQSKVVSQSSAVNVLSLKKTISYLIRPKVESSPSLNQWVDVCEEKINSLIAEILA